jgi:hypothetical protein
MKSVFALILPGGQLQTRLRAVNEENHKGRGKDAAKVDGSS